MKKGLCILICSLLFVACTKSRSKKNCNTFTEAEDPQIEMEGWKASNERLSASFASIDYKYSKSRIPEISQTSTKNKLEGWMGERVSTQILLWSTENISQVEFEFSNFKSGKNTLPSSIAQARFVRYVLTDEFGKGCGNRTIDEYSSSLVPDMLDTLNCFNIEAKTVRPVWITIDIPQDINPGVYKGTINIYAEGKEFQEFSLELDIIDQTLPKASKWKMHVDFWQHPSAVARVHKLKLWSDEHFEKMKPLMKMLANMGQKVITTNVNKDPWNNQCFDAYADMIKWIKKKDGNWVYDYTIFDKWVQFMMDLGINRMINCYSMAPWNNELHYFDESTKKTINIKADPGTENFNNMWEPFLADFADHLSTKGWLEITNIAMDERTPKEMEIILATLHKIAPELGIAFADNQNTYKRYPNIRDLSVSIDAKVDLNDIADRRKKELITTFYVCCSDEFPNTFTFSDAAEATYISWYAAALDYDGLLRWAYNSWVENPLIDSRFRTWPAGDTYFVYPDARSSIRYERMLEGIQDYEKIIIVKNKLKEKNDIERLELLSTSLLKLKSNIRTATWNLDLNEAKKPVVHQSLLTKEVVHD